MSTYIRGYYNKQPHSGCGMWGRSPDEAFAELPREKRVVPQDKLNLMLMRYSGGTMTVGKNGVTLTLYGEKIQFTDEYLWEHYFGQEVYIRYTPDDLSTVRVYNTDNKFICEAVQEKKLSYHATSEEVQEANRKKKTQEKLVKNYKSLKSTRAQDALDTIVENAAANAEMPENVNTEVLRLLQSGESLPEPLQHAAGAETAALHIDFTAAAERARQQRRGNY